jgi:hypothetical protein
MIIYNVTTHIDHSVHEAWLTWMKEIHIPEVMQRGCFTKFQMTRMLEVDETEGATYTIQYYAESKADYNRFIELHAPALRQSIMDKWGDKTLSFRSIMQVVH